MAERLFGIETEYAVGSEGAGRTRALAALMQRVRKEFPCLPDEMLHGVFLGNASRFYVDRGGHPEMTTPECAHPRDVVRYLRAGEAILLRLARRTALFRSNVDYAGARSSWASHESYMHRADLRALPRRMIPHFVSRLVYTGAGGFVNVSPGLRFTLSPRVAHLEVPQSSESTGHRGIFHDKNEPLAGNGWSRLHVLCGESLYSETATFLRVGATALVVALAEAGLSPGASVDLAAPVSAMQAYAADPTCRARAATRDGRQVSAVDVQHAYLELAERHAGADFMPPWAGEVCARWRATLDDLADGGAQAALSLDWAIKRRVYDDHLRRRGVTWTEVEAWNGVVQRLSDALAFERREDWLLDADVVLSPASPIRDAVKKLTPKLRRLGLAWDGLAPFLRLRNELFEVDTRFGQLGAGGLFAALDASGLLRQQIDGTDDVAAAVETPPPVPRAQVRGRLVRELSGCAEHGRYVCDWDGVWDREEELCVDLSDPFTATSEWRPWADDGAMPGRFLPGMPRRRARRQVPPREPIALNQAALEHRARGDFAEAERLLRQAIPLEDARVTPDSPKRPHRRNNLAVVLMCAGKLDESARWNAEAWALKAGCHDVTSGRILFVRVALTYLRGHPDADLPLGQLKELLAGGSLPCLGDIAPTWDIGDVLAVLDDVLRPSTSALMVDLAQALNVGGPRSSLERHPAWARAVPTPLDTPWPPL